MKKNCLIVFDKSWGEVDYIYPLLKILKKKYNLIIFFSCQEFYNQKKYYVDLYKEIKKYAHIILNDKKSISKPNTVSYWNQFLDIDFLVNKIKTINFKTLINFFNKKKKTLNYSYINFIKKKGYHLDLILIGNLDMNPKIFTDNFKYSKFAIMPHAVSIRLQKFKNKRNIDINKLKNVNEIRKKHFDYYNKKKAILFANSNDEREYFKDFAQNLTIKSLGVPRYKNKFLKINLKKKIKNILLLIGKESYIGKRELLSKLENVLKVSKTFNCNVILKNHPRNSREILNILKKKNFCFVESRESIYKTLKKCDLMILTSKSGVCMDAINQSVPVIEFYKYNSSIFNNKIHEFKINKKFMSSYNYFGLVKSVDKNNDFKNLIGNLQNLKKRKDLILRQRLNYSKLEFSKLDSVKIFYNYIKND